MADEGADPAGGGLFNRLGRGGRGGQKSWMSAGVEFDTKGVQAFTTEISKAEKVTAKFVGHFRDLDKILKGMDQKKIDALSSLGTGKPGGSFIDASPISTPTGAGGVRHGAGTNEISPGAETPASTMYPGGNGGSRAQARGAGGDRIADAYFVGEIAQRVGARAGAAMEGARQGWSAVDYANYVGSARTGRSAASFGTAASWNNLHGVADSADATALMTQANMRGGTSLGTPGYNQFIRGFADLNAINPAIGGANVAQSQYRQTFMSSDAMWNQIQYGMTPSVVRGVERPTQDVMGDMILRATGKSSFGDLSKREALAMFGPTGTARRNIEQVLAPGISPEMLDAMSIMASEASGGRGIRAATQSKAFKDTVVYEQMKGTADEAGLEAERTREGKEMLKDVTALEGAWRRTMGGFIAEFSEAIPVVGSLAGAVAGLTGAAATAGGLTGEGGIGSLLGLGLDYKILQALRGKTGPGMLGRAAGRFGLTGGRALAGGLATGVGSMLGEWGGQAAGEAVGGKTGGSVGGFLGAVGGGAAVGAGVGVFGAGAGAIPGALIGGALGGVGWGVGKLLGDPVAGVDSRYARDIGDPQSVQNIPGDLDAGFSSNLKRMVAAAPFNITVSSGRRSTQRQEEIFLSRHRVVAKGTPGAKYYKGKYYARIPGTAAVAVPGTSKHEKGHAVDLRIDGISANSHRGWQTWVDANAPKFGLRHGASFGEWWHIETPGTVSESGGSSVNSETPTPRSGSGSMATGGGIANHNFRSDPLGEISTSALVGSLAKSPGFEHALLGGGGGAAVAGVGGGSAPMGGNEGMIGVLRNAGFSGEGLRLAYAVMMGESQGNPNAYNGDASTGDKSYGLFQINMLGAMGPERRKQYGLGSNSDLFNPQKNAEVAFKMSGGGKNWQPWSAYKNGSYRQYYRDDIGDPVGPDGRGANAGGGSYGGGGTGSTAVSMGNRTITIQNVNLNVKMDQVTREEAERLGRMFMQQLQEHTEMAELGKA